MNRFSCFVQPSGDPVLAGFQASPHENRERHGARSPYDTLVTVYGGSGFLGRHVVRALAKRHYRIRVAVRRPELAGHLQPLGRNMRCRQSATPPRSKQRRAMRRCSSISWEFYSSAAASDSRRCTLTAQSRSRWRRVHTGPGWSMCRRSVPMQFAERLCAHQGRRGKAGAGGATVGIYHAAINSVRAGGRFLQSLCCPCAPFAGAAADRWRADTLSAGVRRRRCAGYRRCR